MPRSSTTRKPTRRTSTTRKSSTSRKPRPTARTKSAPRKAATLAGPPKLVWKQGGPRLRTAVAKGGTYSLISHDGVDWTADFRPVKGRPTAVLFRKPLEACVTACERDHVLRFTNEVLVANGAQSLAAADLQGDAVAWKHRRF